METFIKTFIRLYVHTIECFHSRGQHLCKFIRTKQSVCTDHEEKSSNPTGLVILGNFKFLLLFLETEVHIQKRGPDHSLVRLSPQGDQQRHISPGEQTGHEN